MKEILPVLKPMSEYKLQTERGMFVNKLMDFEESPFVLYGTDMGIAMAYTQSSNKEENENIKKQALENLKTKDVNLSFENFEGMKTAIVQGEYAAEKILDEDFLNNISSKLGNSKIVIGIPVKGFFVAVSEDSNLLKFGAVIQKQFKNPQQTYGISELLFVAENGKLINAGKGIKNSKTESDKPWWKFW